MEPSSSYEKSIEVRSPKTRLENQDEQRLLTPNQRRGKQHQRQLNSDPTQRDVVSNRSQNLRKKRTNIDRNNIQRRKKTTAQHGTNMHDLQQILDNLT